MRSKSNSASFSRFLQERPWIWIVIAYCAFVASTISFVVIAVKHREPSVPVDYHGR